MISTWNCPTIAGETSEELVVQFDKSRAHRLLVIPALFDEANKLRRTTVEIMRRLDLSGIDSFLPDLPGTNESCEPLDQQTLSGWKAAIAAAAEALRATHVLAVRSGALLSPSALPGWQYAPLSGPKLLRSMMRARSIAAKEAGRDETMAQMQELGRSQGIELGGWQMGPRLFADLEVAEIQQVSGQDVISQSNIGGAGLWLRAEPDEDPEQADALAAIIAVALLGDGESQ
ncbi:hypothetical protein AMC99_01305 [Altererythrobacter epoxidivorans]|uniref:Uncharacterized protein n=1 Tax=Altererythrobacter epoxidivorans TaxID=361183 RepID=A0A0M5KZG6_9SPHN|nr:hypothetical protein [Altererythrobacter epoxidivorans]ALE16599.1 hypothetical protein AMC99_01305 [Altererythrobacter epoxidivorans]